VAQQQEAYTRKQDSSTKVEPTNTNFFFCCNRKLLFVQGSPIRRANLLQVLDEPGDFTFFAPNNNAFRSIPVRFLELLFLQDAFIPHLEDLLLYHGLIGERFVADFFAIEIINTFNNEGVQVRREPSNSLLNLLVNGNSVRRRNINASNGVTHVIGGVLAPDWVSNSILDFVVVASDLSLLFEFIERAGLSDALDVFGQELTLVAPTNAAFNALGTAILEALRDPANQQFLIAILAYHVILGVITTDALDELDGSSLATAEGSAVVVSVEVELGVTIRTINQARVMSTDSILANNGAFYRIEAVLNPNSLDGFL
jgi:transforming growth factor-beta-induced protein